ncbi:potyviral helper component protease-interacting protein 2 [Striga asiatica]|uniref:Potyviral helper component protease-interacting protein 2 n=1 Tax=Striga asiatica TaxID=4170 RepID=A0A5A7RC72_STRAF|nr:potyviral helper component protease-interacting protein 2 [Striga asiatica]
MRSTKPSKQTVTAPPPRTSLSSHLAMVELKQRILTSLSKLSDRDTHQIALDDLEKIILSLSTDAVSMLLNCLYDAAADPKPPVKKEGVRLLAVLCAVHTDPASTHLTKIIAHIVRRLKDSDSQIREACCDAIGSLAGLYLKPGGGGGDGVVSLFVKPLFEVMNENNKAAQGGAALCLAKMVECASDPPLTTFQKLCTRVCKYLNSPNFTAKASLLQVVSSLSQVGAIAPQSLEPLLQSIHECLSSSDWATRKAAADILIVISSNTSNITAEVAASTVNALEASRFDKVKPVRESMTEALQLWKKIAGKGDGSSDENKASSHDDDNSEYADPSDRKELPSSGDRGSAKSVKHSPRGSSPTDPNSKGKGNNILDKAVGILKKKAPGLTDKELNPEFFQKLETRVSDDLPVEVVLPRRCANPSNPQNEEKLQSNADPNRTRLNCQAGDGAIKTRHENVERRAIGDYNQRDPSNTYPDFSRTPGQPEGFMNNKGNWMAIQRQLLQLERQQAHLMNMLQEFMGGSHDGMLTLEDRVRGLERVVEDMARDLSKSSGRMTGDPRFEVPTNSRSLGKYNGFPDYSSGKLGRGGDGRIHIGERFSTFDGPTKLRSPYGSDSWDFPYGKSGQMGSRRGGPMDARPNKPESNNDQIGSSRRAWEKGSGLVRFGEGPSARSVWQASKDEATLEAIRVAGEENGVTRGARVAMPERTAEALGDDDDDGVRERDPVWTAWSNAMAAFDVGDMDTAFAEVLSTCDDVLLMKLMDRSGPVFDQLSTEVANEVLNAISQLLILGHNVYDVFLYWIQQLTDIIMENGPDVLGIPMEVKRDILLNLHESSSIIELPEVWEGSTPDQLLIQLASAWDIDLENLGK